MSLAKAAEVLFVQPGGQSAVYQGLHQQMTAIEPPLWALLLASYLIPKKVSCEILDANLNGWSPDETAQRVEAMNPGVVAIVVAGHQPSASTQTMPAVREICLAIKKNNPARKIILIGGHAAALPEITLHEEAVDGVSTGEGFKTLLEIALQNRKGIWEPADIPDFCYAIESEIRKTAAAGLLTALDSDVPEILWDLVPVARYRAHNWHCFGDSKRSPYASIYTTLGCPYRCDFCCIHSIFQSGEKEASHSYRFWSPDWVIRQIDHLVERHGVRHIKIADEMFVLNASHVEEICHRIIDRGYDLSIWAYARVDTISNKNLELMRRAGIRWFALGIESASSKVRDGADKNFSDQQIRDSVQSLRKSGISVIANYIFGLPDDDLFSMHETLDLAIELNTEFANFYCAMAYPGSPLYERAVRELWPLPETWEGYSQHSPQTFPLPTRHLSSQEVLRFRDEAFQIYFNRPEYLAMIQKKFGQAAVLEIETMLSKKIIRDVSASYAKLPVEGS